MSNIDKQAVQAIADLKSGYTLGHADVSILSELARIALASLEAEAVGEIVLGEYDDCGCHQDARVVCIAADGQADWENFKDGTRLYTAPPAPVSVPDDVMAAMQKVARIRLDLNDFDGDKRGILDFLGDAEEALIEVVNRRAAMIQGAGPVQRWIPCSEQMPEDAQWCAVNTEYGYYVQCWSDGQGWLGDDISIPKCDVTHWMPLPAAPQQEVKK